MQFALLGFLTPEYLLLIIFLASLTVLLMLSVLKMGLKYKDKEEEGGRS